MSVTRLGWCLALMLLAPVKVMANDPPVEAIDTSTQRQAAPVEAASPIDEMSVESSRPPSPLGESMADADLPTAPEAVDDAWVVESINWLDQAVAVPPDSPNGPVPGNEVTEEDTEGLVAVSPDSPNGAEAAAPWDDLEGVDFQAAASNFSAADLQLGDSAAAMPVAEGTLIPQLAQETAPSEAASVWHYSFEPFLFIPVNTNVNLRVNDIDVNFDAGISDVAASLDSLNFAFLGKFEAWRENIGIVFDIEYFALGTSNSRDFTIPPRLQGTIPSNLTSNASADLLKADLLFAYRFADAPENGYGEGFTEFDLPPVSFDLMGGLRFFWLAQAVSLSSNLGGFASESSSSIAAEPVIRGRLRWNTSDYLALKLDADISGFGIDNFLTFSYSALASLEWLFSGNTSLTAGYQINYFDAQTDGGSNKLNLTAHGPYLSFTFRF